MTAAAGSLIGEDALVFALRELYARTGYRQYQMSKFEEYDLYARNRDFLPSEQIITFTDTTGKLMALKPDVTISIIKNIRDVPDTLQRLYYDERVYRVSASGGSFQVLRQLGLECIGALDDYALSEVLMLAAASLRQLGVPAVLEVSQLDIVGALLDAAGLDYDGRAAAERAVGGKNLHELSALLEEHGTDREAADTLLALLGAPGTPEAVFRLLETSPERLIDKSAAAQLRALIAGLPEELSGMIRIDFSLTGNRRYYNGVIFQGYIQGVPSRVLSGGQYDRMMERMGRRSLACGFAVYVDLLERLFRDGEEYDFDVALLYGEGDAVGDIHAAAEDLRRSGRSVYVARTLPGALRFREITEIGGAKRNG